MDTITQLSDARIGQGCPTPFNMNQTLLSWQRGFTGLYIEAIQKRLYPAKNDKNHKFSHTCIGKICFRNFLGIGICIGKIWSRNFFEVVICIGKIWSRNFSGIGICIGKIWSRNFFEVDLG